jgi:predicted dithiol-disulfide oxidoreductase (DUF899 family)
MPSASDAYREAREEVLNAELELSEHIERVATLRRTLPVGPLQVPHPYGLSAQVAFARRN